MLVVRHAKRLFSTPPLATSERVVVQRVGAFRGGMFGFMLGLSAASSLCYIYLLEEYQLSSNTHQGIEDLQKTTLKLRDYTLKIDGLEAHLKELSNKFTTKDDSKLMKNELLKLIDDVAIDGMETKQALWELSQKK